MTYFSKVSAFVCRPLTLALLFGLVAVFFEIAQNQLFQSGIMIPGALLAILLGVLEAHREYPSDLLSRAIGLTKFLAPIASASLFVIWV